jgi:cytochrome c556
MNQPLALLATLTTLLLAACGGGTGPAAPMDVAPAAHPVPETIATTRQVMLGITVPTSNALFQIGEGPKDDAGWELVVANANALAESGNLLLTGTRRIEQPEWAAFAQALIAAAKTASAAALEKNAEKVLESGDAIYGSCESCHAKYLPQPAAQPPVDAAAATPPGPAP